MHRGYHRLPVDIFRERCLDRHNETRKYSPNSGPECNDVPSYSRLYTRYSVKCYIPRLSLKRADTPVRLRPANFFRLAGRRRTGDK